MLGYWLQLAVLGVEEAKAQRGRQSDAAVVGRAAANANNDPLRSALSQGMSEQLAGPEGVPT